MAAYILVRVDVTNPDAYREYTLHTPRVIEQFGGRFLIRGGEMTTLEGPEEKLRIVLIEFPSLEQAKAFYASTEYGRIKKFREGAGTGQFIAINGYPVEQWEAAAAASAKLTPPL